MANTLITMDKIAASALAHLYNTIVLAGLVNRDYESDFTGAQGDTISVKLPATFTAQEFSRPSGITIQDATESSTTVTLDTLLDVSFALPAEQLTLEIENLEQQFLIPAMEAIAQGVDERLAVALVEQARAHTPDWVGDGTTDPNQAFRDSRAVLSRQNLPLMNRYAVMSPEAVSAALGDDLLVTANQSGSTAALRNATVGRVFGFDTYETQAFGGSNGVAGEADGVAFHRDAVALVTRTLALPKGAAQAAVRSYKGLGVRVVYDYDIDQKQDVCSIDLLIGVQDLRDNAAVELDFGQGS